MPRLVLPILAALLFIAAARPAPAQPDILPPATQPAAPAFERMPPDAQAFKFYIRGRERRVAIIERDGIRWFLVERSERVETLTPDQFAKAVADQQGQLSRRPWLQRLLNITSWSGVAWIAVGLIGQAMFTFRMVLQWLASEKEGKSVIPVAFWWGSLIGGLMLLSYFIWRWDIIGVIGQSTGAFIYVRNLVLIYRAKARDRQATE